MHSAVKLLNNGVAGGPQTPVRIKHSYWYALLKIFPTSRRRIINVCVSFIALGQKWKAIAAIRQAKGCVKPHPISAIEVRKDSGCNSRSQAYGAIHVEVKDKSLRSQIGMV